MGDTALKEQLNTCREHKGVGLPSLSSLRHSAFLTEAFLRGETNQDDDGKEVMNNLLSKLVTK